MPTLIPPLFGDFGDLVVLCPGSSRRCRAASKEVPGGQGKPRAPERWPESSGRGLDDDSLTEAFSCQVWSFSVLLGRVQVIRGALLQHNVSRVIRKRENDDLYLTLPKQYLG